MGTGQYKISFIVPIKSKLEIESFGKKFLKDSNTCSDTPVFFIAQDHKGLSESTSLRKLVYSIHSNPTKNSPYSGRNKGVLLSKNADYIVFIDINKTPIQEDWFNRLLLELDQKKTDMLVIPAKVSAPFSAFKLSQRFDCYNFQTPSTGDIDAKRAFPLSMWAIKTEFFHKVGNFLEVRSLGDIEWVTRAYKHNPLIRISELIQVEYTPRSGTRVFLKAVRMGFGKKQIYLHEGNWSALLFFGFKQLLPPNPLGQLHRMRARKYPYIKRDFVPFYLFTYASKFCYFWGLFKSKAPNE